MQTADTLKIDSYDTLYTMITTIEPPNRRRSVLQAIADPKISIGHEWSNCLFAVATRAVRSFIKNIRSTPVNAKVAANALGIPVEWVNQGVAVWDSGLDHERKTANEAFRNRIRKYLAGIEEPVVVQVAPLSA